MNNNQKINNYIYYNKYNYYTKNIITLLMLFSLILVVYFSYIKLYINPRQQKALKEFFYAKKYFINNDFNKALGDINSKKGYLGFLGISEKYPLTKAGNISKYFTGICYYKLHQYRKSIEYFREFITNDEIFPSIKYGIIGDAFDFLKDKDRALKYYIIASNIEENEFSFPLYIYKAAVLCYYDNNYEYAKKYFIEIKNNFSISLFSKDIDKHINISASKAIKIIDK